MNNQSKAALGAALLSIYLVSTAYSMQKQKSGHDEQKQKSGHDEPLTVDNPNLRVDFDPRNRDRGHEMDVTEVDSKAVRLRRDITKIESVSIKYRGAANPAALNPKPGAPILLEDSNGGWLFLTTESVGSDNYFIVTTTGQMGACRATPGMRRYRCSAPGNLNLRAVWFMDAASHPRYLCFDDGQPPAAGQSCRVTGSTRRAYIEFQVAQEKKKEPRPKKD